VEEGVSVISLLGVVILAKRRNLIPSARTLVRAMEEKSGFYLSEDLKEQAFRAVSE
jgi:predicted nucleic acid-binding protein